MPALRHDLTNQRFGKLTVLSRNIDITVQGGDPQWICQCDCGNIVSVRSYQLRQQRTQSCGCLRKKTPPNFTDLTGKQFGRLTVLHRDESIHDHTKGAAWVCQCLCGNVTSVLTKELNYGSIQSCGCLRDELLAQGNLKHGSARRGQVSPEYKAWKRMKERCHTSTSKNYPRYGGRGIVVCDRWRNSFEAFLEDVGPRPTPKHSLDRYPDNNGNYEPGNVRWATRTEQARNTRSTVFLTLNGETHCLSEWSEIVHIKHSILVDRHSYGWPDEQILTTPVRQWPGRITHNGQGSLF